MTGRNAPERRPERAAFAIAAFLAAFGALLVWDSARIIDKGGYAGVGPADFPRVIGYGLIALAVWTVLAGLRGAISDGASEHRPAPILLILLGLALQLVLVRPLGFTVGSGLLFACTAAAFGNRRLAVILPAGLTAAFVVYVIFDRLLQLNLPAGPLENLVLGG